VVYTVALVRRAASVETGRAFIGHLASTEAKAVFRTAGFVVAN
jgi:ABC-type molybdate transport system substrate-binding protein